MRVHCLQHAAFEGPGTIEAWARDRGHALRSSVLFDGGALPALDDFDGLVVMGGPMGVRDEARFPWLTAEKRLIEAAIEVGKTVLGICLGSQLIADVLGARVYRNAQPEIGWFPVRRGRDAAGSPLFRDFPAEFPALHWHNDVFDLPAGAQHLAFSEASPNQAFAHRSAIGLLFHLEMDRDSLSSLVQHCGHEIGSGPFEQVPGRIVDSSAPFEECKSMLWALLDRISAREKLQTLSGT